MADAIGQAGAFLVRELPTPRRLLGLSPPGRLQRRLQHRLLWSWSLGGAYGNAVGSDGLHPEAGSTSYLAAPAVKELTAPSRPEEPVLAEVVAVELEPEGTMHGSEKTETKKPTKPLKKPAR